MLPAIMFIIALLVRMPIRQAVLATIRLAAGFAGIFIAFEFFVNNINPAVLALTATILVAVYTIKLSEWTAPEVERETGLKGIAISPLSSVGLLPYAVGINRLIERIPGLKSINYNPHRSGKDKGDEGEAILSEPMVIGVVVGLLLVIALVLPGNRTLPLGDLPSLISQVSVIVLISRGNVFRSVLAGIPLVTGYLLIASRLAPLITRLSKEVGATFPEGAVITAFTDGGNPVRFWVLELFTGNWIAFTVIPVVAFLLYLSRNNYRRSLRELNSGGNAAD